MLGWTFIVMALLGALYQVFAGLQVRALARATAAASYDASPRPWPAVTVVKPLHGDEIGLYANLEGFCLQDYDGPVQIVFGVHDVGDPAVRVVRELQRAHPACDIALVIDNRLHGENRKVCNLINMAAAIRGDVVVLSDSDIQVRRDYLREVVGPLAEPSVGFVTSLYTGRPAGTKPGVGATGTTAASLAAMGINYQFLPNVLVGVRLGMAYPCFGATVALRREVLEAIGGFSVLVDQLADDYDLGRAVRAAGYVGRLAPRPVAHLCDERSWRQLWSHEFRWNRTIRAIDPAGFLGAGITHALPWALLACLAAPGPSSILALTLVVAARLFVIREVDRAVGVKAQPLHLLPVRELMSFALFVSAFFGRSVMWRGRRYLIGRDGAIRPSEEILHASHPVPSSAFLRRLRWGRGVALPGQAGDQVVLVSDLAGAAGGLGREQPADRRPAA